MRTSIALLGFALLNWLPAASLAAPPGAVPLAGKRLDDAALARQRGRADTSTGVVLGNQAINVVTGSNTITGGSLAGASGVPVVIQNSGNNVLIQSSVTVNVTMK